MCGGMILDPCIDTATRHEQTFLTNTQLNKLSVPLRYDPSRGGIKEDQVLGQST